VRYDKPPALQPKDRVRIIAPSGPFDRESFDRGLSSLAGRYQPVHDDGLFARERYLAGPDARRLEELRRAFADPDARAVFCARGGYGLMRLLPGLRPEDLRALPHKPLVGFSDVTALHLALQRAGRVSFHAPVVTQLGRQGTDVHQRLWHLLESDQPPPALAGTEALVKGTVEGPLLGGNLSVLTRLLGTPFLPDLRGAVLLLEDVGERPYRLDRMWTHLRLAGVFDQVVGIVLGDFTLCDERGESYGPLDILRELAREVGLPCATGFPIGHGEVNQPVPLGIPVRLRADDAALEFLEPAVEPSSRSAGA
jgi:muramoyltetrapeptide carboxypeptidase